MSDSDVKTGRYSLRPTVGRFDLRINKNRYGLIRTTTNRAESARSTLNSAKKITKRKICYELVPNNDIQAPCNLTLRTNATTLPLPNRPWRLPEVSINFVRDQQSVYDTSAPANFMDLDENSTFGIFESLSLDDFCSLAEAQVHRKLAAQKYFEVIYTSMNIAWLIKEDAEKFTLLQAERLLRNFGHLISTLTVNTDQLDNVADREKLLELISKYCTGILFWDTK